MYGNGSGSCSGQPLGDLAGSFIAAAGPVVDYILEGEYKQRLRLSTVFAFATVRALIMMGIAIVTRLPQQ